MFFSFFPFVVETPPVTTTTGPQSLFAGHGVQTKQQPSSTSTSSSGSSSNAAAGGGVRVGVVVVISLAVQGKNNTQEEVSLQVGVVVGGGTLEQHTGPQSLFAGGCCCGRGPWNNTRGRSVCLQVGVVVGGALEQHTGPQSLFAGQAQSNIQGFCLVL